MYEECVIDDFVEGGALLWVWCEDLLDELPGFDGDASICGEFVLVIPDSPKGGLVLVGRVSG